MIVATAGHVDHGKTSIVRALTGVDTDRLAEEKARGLTIELGFAYRSIDGGGRIGFVDVPGHERFVHTMAAGVGGVDCALLVVAADDGVMPQTREHVAILAFLGVVKCIVAVSKIDRVEASRVDEVRAEVENLLSGTGLEAMNIIPVSAVSGAGMEKLWDALAKLASSQTSDKSMGGFRMPIDRAFTLQGSGLVLTGTASSGRVRTGDRLNLVPSGGEVRVRSLHALNEEATEGFAGQRLGINVSGSDAAADAGRGHWLVGADVAEPTMCMDVALRTPKDAAAPFKGRGRFHLHIGTADILCSAQVLGDAQIAPGTQGYVRLRLQEPAVAVFGDRLILRDASSRVTLAGGRVIDPFAPKRRRRGEDRIAVLQAMDADDPAASLAGLLALPGMLVGAKTFRQSRNIDPGAVAEIAEAAGAVTSGTGDEAVFLSPAYLQVLSGEIVETLGTWHLTHPDYAGMPSDKLFGVRCSESKRVALDAALASTIGDGRVRRHGSLIALATHHADFAGRDRVLWMKVEALLQDGGSVPPRVHELAETLNMRATDVTGFLRRAVRLGKVHPVAENRYFLPEKLDELAAVARRLDAGGEGFDAKMFRDAAGIGRNLAIEVLEYLDSVAVTRRDGDRRRTVS